MNTQSLLLRKAGLIAGAMFFVVFLSIAGCGSSSDPFSLIERFQEIMAEQGTGKGEIIAKIEGTPIYKNVFDMQVDMALKYSGMSPEEQLRERNDIESQKQMLESAVLSQAIMEDMRNDPEILNDPEFIVFINMTLMQGLQQYYIAKKLDTRISMEVTAQDIAREYDELIKNPQFRDQLSRAPKAEVDRALSRQVLQRRRQSAMQKLLLDLQGKYRITKYEEKLTGVSAEETE
jgi:hypothetical protein